MIHALKQWRVAVVLVVLALIAAACGGTEDTTTTSTTAAPAETTTTAAGEGGEEMVTTLSGLTKIDDNTFQVELTNPDPEFPIQMGYAAYFALPDVAFEDQAAFEEAPIGNGPFMMDGTWEHDVRIATVPYPDYAGSDPAQIDRYVFEIYEEITTAYVDALAGNLDVVNTIPSDFLATYQDEFPGRNGDVYTTGFNYLGFPTYLEQYTKKHRQALSMAVDRELITEQIFLGARDPAHSVIPPNLQGRDDVCPSWNYDPVAAKALWDEAEAEAPIGDIVVWFNSGAGNDDWVQAVVNQWGTNLGIDTSAVTFESLEFSEYLPIADNAEFTGPFRLGWGMDYPSPYNFLYPLYHSDSHPLVGSNNTFYDNPDFDAALADGVDKLAVSGDLADALPDYYAAEDLLCDDAQVMPMFWSKSQFVWNEGTDNVFVDAHNDLGSTKLTADDGEVSQHISEPEHLFPTTSNESEGIEVLRSLFRGLVHLDAATNEINLEHAESITSEDDGATWIVTLNPGWTFHNGDPVTADSYINAWNYGAYGANGQQNNSFYSNIVGYADINEESDG